MKNHRHWVPVTTIAAALASALIAPPAFATTATGFTATPVAKGVYGEMDLNADKSGTWDLKLKTKSDTDVYVTRNSIANGGQSGWHTHPGPSLITVTIGEITVYEADL